MYARKRGFFSAATAAALIIKLRSMAEATSRMHFEAEFIDGRAPVVTHLIFTSLYFNRKAFMTGV